MNETSGMVGFTGLVQDVGAVVKRAQKLGLTRSQFLSRVAEVLWPAWDETGEAACG